jgi:hypothetical protein
MALGIEAAGDNKFGSAGVYHLINHLFIFWNIASRLPGREMGRPPKKTKVRGDHSLRTSEILPDPDQSVGTG